MPSVAGGAEHAAGVVAAPVVPAVGTKEDVQAGAAVLPGAGALLVRVVLDLAGEQLVEECGQVDGQARFPAGAAVGIILGREPVESAVDLAELPLDVQLASAGVAAFQPDGLAPPQARCSRS